MRKLGLMLTALAAAVALVGGLVFAHDQSQFIDFDPWVSGTEVKTVTGHIYDPGVFFDTVTVIDTVSVCQPNCMERVRFDWTSSNGRPFKTTIGTAVGNPPRLSYSNRWFAKAFLSAIVTIGSGSITLVDERANPPRAPDLTLSTPVHNVTSLVGTLGLSVSAGPITVGGKLTTAQSPEVTWADFSSQAEYQGLGQFKYTYTVTNNFSTSLDFSWASAGISGSVSPGGTFTSSVVTELESGCQTVGAASFTDDNSNAVTITAPALVPSPCGVGGIAELPDLPRTPAGQSTSSQPPYTALAGGLAAVLLALTTTAWYARRRLRKGCRAR